MTDTVVKQKPAENLDADHDTQEPSAVLSDKRMAQHAHWMRVMMEGQSTPDLRYQRSKK